MAAESEPSGKEGKSSNVNALSGPISSTGVTTMQTTVPANGPTMSKNTTIEDPGGGDESQFGPYIAKSASKNVIALLGKTAYLNCRVKNLGNKTVRICLLTK